MKVDMKKRFSLLVLSSILLSNTAFAAEGTTISGLKSLNNFEKSIDYKDSDFGNRSKSLNLPYQIVETQENNPERDMTNLSIPRSKESDVELSNGSVLEPLTTAFSDKELSWLIEHNVVSRDKKITINGGELNVDKGEPLYDLNNPNEPVSKTNFLVGMYKAIYGPISSRPVLINIESVREASEISYVRDKKGNLVQKILPRKRQQVSRTGKSYMYTPQGYNSDIVSQFPDGDFYTYVTANVPELYLKELLDKNIVGLDELSDISYKNTYKALGTTSNGKTTFPLWYNSLGVYSLNFSGIAVSDSNLNYDQSTMPLGASYNIPGVSAGSLSGDSSTKVVIERTNQNYFVNETISTIEALRYLESMVRLTEKDMTDTEAQIVTYKYGSSYLNYLNDQDRKTVMFLTAKGILNFEDKTEYRNLYGTITKEFFYKLLYRVSNKDARLNFSEIKLTDTDNFWIGKGFTEVKMKVNSVNPSRKTELQKLAKDVLPVPDIRTDQVMLKSEYDAKKESASVSNKLFSFATKKGFYFAGPNNSQVYTIIQIFDTLDKYVYQGVPLKDLLDGKKVSDDIKSYKKVDPSNNDSKAYEVEFNVNATSPQMAVATITSRFQSLWEGNFSSEELKAVTKYSSDNKETTLVPASIFKSPDSTIQILEDKVLLNRDTGATAVLLQDKNIALVGTHVIQSSDLMVTPINGERYYNMEIISKIMSNMYISQLDKNSVYFTNGIQQDTEKLTPIQASTGSTLGKTYVAKFSTAPKTLDNGEQDYGSAYFANISQMTAGENIIIRDFSTEDPTTKEPIKFKAVLEFNYQQPPDYVRFGSTGNISDNPTLKEVNDFFYSPPKGCDDPVKQKDSGSCSLLDWWNNNLDISNAFANVFYGTHYDPSDPNTRYIRSGYLVPRVSLLFDYRSPTVSNYINTVLQQVGAELPKSWTSRFLGDMDNYNNKVSSEEDSVNGDGIFYPKKLLDINSFPKWVHAMFNNYKYVPVDSNTRKNSELWRIMMKDRTFDNADGAALVGNNYQYKTKNGTFIVTNGGDGAVYKMIDEDTGTAMKMHYDEEKNILNLTTRTSSSVGDQFIGKKVRLGDNVFTVLSSDGNKLDLIDNSLILGQPYQATIPRGGTSYYEISGSLDSGAKRMDSIRSRYLELQSLFTCKTTVVDTNLCVGFDDAVPSFDQARFVTARAESLDSGYVMYMDNNGLNGVTNDTKVFYDMNSQEYRSFDEVMSQQDATVGANVLISVKQNYWTVDSEGNLIPRRVPSAFQIPNLYYSSLTKGVIDSIMLNSISTVDPNDIPEGGRLYIGDLLFTKAGDKFISYPVKVQGSQEWTALVSNADDPQHVSDSIAVALSKFSLKAGSMSIPLPAYITSSGLSIPMISDPMDKTLVGDGTNALIHTRNAKGELTKEPYDSGSIAEITTAVVYITLDKGLAARMVNSDDRVYQLLMATNSLSEGNLPNVKFFTESLSLKAKEDIFLSTIRADYKPLSAAKEFRDNFLKMYDEAFRKDLTTTLRAAFTTLFMSMIVMTWVGYAIVKGGLLYPILKEIKDPVVGSRRSGFDVIKWISFGMYSLDNEPIALKVITVNIILFVLIYILVNVLG